MIGLIMAGGVGSRFWPVSRKSRPKQYLNIISEKTMIQLTVERLLKKIELEDIYVVTSLEQKELVLRDLPKLPEENVILEPFGRNTAPCVALAAKFLSRKYEQDEVILTVPADHLIPEHDDFWQKTLLGETAAKKDFLVTFGIEPTYPATGYGYIESKNKWKEGLFHVKQFKEKPNKELATKFLKQGNFYWNSGMFLWKINTILNKFESFLPKVDKLLTDINNAWETQGMNTDISDLYEKMPKIPIDIGIMEQAENRIVVPVNYKWSDVGSWKALYDILEKDENENIIQTENITIDSQQNFVKSEKFTALIGVENLVVVETNDSILITNKNRTQDVKKIVDNLKKMGKTNLL